MKIYKSKKQLGLTLIELLLIISIIGVLTSIILISLNRVKDGVLDAKIATDLKALSEGLELYFQDHGQYPAFPYPYGRAITNFSPEWDSMLKPALSPYLTAWPRPNPPGRPNWHGTYVYINPKLFEDPFCIHKASPPDPRGILVKNGYYLYAHMSRSNLSIAMNDGGISELTLEYYKGQDIKILPKCG